MPPVDAPPQDITQTGSEAYQTPLRTYSRRRGQLVKPLSSQRVTDKRVFRRIKSFHDVADVRDEAALPRPATVSPQRTKSWMVLVQSGRRDSDPECEKELTLPSPSLPNNQGETPADEEDNVAAASQQCESTSTDEDGEWSLNETIYHADGFQEASDDFSDTEGDLTALLDSATRYRQLNTPTSARARGKPMVSGRFLVFDKTPPIGYKVLKKPVIAVAQVPKKPSSRVGDGFSSDEAQPSGVAWSGKKRKRVGMMDSMDALELTTSTQKELEAIRRIKPPKTRSLFKSPFDTPGAPQVNSHTGALMNVHSGEGDIESTSYRAPLSHIFEDVEPGRNGQTLQAQPNIKAKESLQVEGPVSVGASGDRSVAKNVHFEESSTSVQDRDSLDGEEEQGIIHTTVIPQSSWVSESQDLNI